MSMLKKQASVVHKFFKDFIADTESRVYWAEIVDQINLLLIKQSIPPIENWIKVRDILAYYIEIGKIFKHKNIHVEMYKNYKEAV